MRLKNNDKEGRRVWLSEGEVSRLMSHIEDTEVRIALRLMVDSGLRTKEVMKAKPSDVKPLDDEEGDYKLRVWEGKGDKYRETWIPKDLAESIRVYADVTDLEADDSLITMSKRTLQRRIKSAREELEEETGDKGWSHLSAHDLRRTWGTQAIEAGVIPTVVMQCGGWEDFDTFQEHYMGQHGDSVIAQVASKVLA